jgi:hypothetical protein
MRTSAALFLCSVLLVLFGPPGLAFAQGPPPRSDFRPRAFRSRQLPKGLPGWFRELDTDRDGQVSLYEWRMAKRSLDEFLRMDRNRDGYLSPEEVLRYQKQ